MRRKWRWDVFKPMYGKDNPAKRPDVREKLRQSALKRYGHKDRAEPARNSLYHNYRRNAAARGLPFELTRPQFDILTSGECFYCGGVPSQVVRNGRMTSGDRSKYTYNGIDRMDNSVGYIIGNCVSCCNTCNKMKRANDVDLFINHAIKIAERWRMR